MTSIAAFAAIGLLALDPSQTVPGSAARVGEFHLEPLPKDARELERRFTPEQIDLLEKLNRRDREHLPRVEPKVEGLVVPAAWPDDELAFSPLPREYPWAAILPKAIVVHQGVQAFGAYEFGRLVRWGPVSTGRKETPTPIGLFSLTWKAKQRRSTDNEQWLLRWYFNFVNSRGVSFHQFELPGYPASHACVRLLERDAEWLYQWGEQWRLRDDGRAIRVAGSAVLIVGVYGGTAAWTSPTAPGTVDLPPIPFWLFAPMRVAP